MCERTNDASLNFPKYPAVSSALVCLRSLFMVILQSFPCASDVMLTSVRKTTTAELERLKNMGVCHTWQYRMMNILYYVVMAMFSNCDMFKIPTAVLKL